MIMAILAVFGGGKARKCDLTKGTCSSKDFLVVKWVCGGKTENCRENESWGNYQTIAGTECGKTVIMNVYDKNCRVGGWSCGDENLKDSLIKYTGDCAVKPPAFSATPSATLVVTVTTKPTLVPTVKPSPSSTVAPTPTPKVGQTPVTGGNLGWVTVGMAGMGLVGWGMRGWAKRIWG